MNEKKGFSYFIDKQNKKNSQQKYKSDRSNFNRNKKKEYVDQKEKEKQEKLQVREERVTESMRLNRYIANAGICSRRDADELISAGKIYVNGKVATELGCKVSGKDEIIYKGKKLNAEKMRYILLNKPKGYVSTISDPQGRKTVIQLVEKACKERIYPVGRLDKETSGLLLFTNDGQLADRLMHPSTNTKKLYHAVLDIPMKTSDFDKLKEGLTLEDGFVKPDNLEFVKGNKDELGIEIHSGKNRIVRRMFEELNYTVIRLDRVQIASLTKKDLTRGKWRHLTTNEVSFLKMIK